MLRCLSMPCLEPLNCYLYSSKLQGLPAFNVDVWGDLASAAHLAFLTGVILLARIDQLMRGADSVYLSFFSGHKGKSLKRLVLVISCVPSTGNKSGRSLYRFWQFRGIYAARAVKAPVGRYHCWSISSLAPSRRHMKWQSRFITMAQLTYAPCRRAACFKVCLI